MDSALQLVVPGRDSATLDEIEQLDGLDVRALRSGDTLVIETSHSHYTLRLTDPRRGEASAQGSGKYLTEESPVRLLGATLSGRGSMVRIGVVMPGFKVVIQLQKGELMTSKVRRIFLNGLPLEASSRIH